MALLVGFENRLKAKPGRAVCHNNVLNAVARIKTSACVTGRTRNQIGVIAKHAVTLGKLVRTVHTNTEIRQFLNRKLGGQIFY